MIYISLIHGNLQRIKNSSSISTGFKFKTLFHETFIINYTKFNHNLIIQNFGHRNKYIIKT